MTGERPERSAQVPGRVPGGKLGNLKNLKPITHRSSLNASAPKHLSGTTMYRYYKEMHTWFIRHHIVIARINSRLAEVYRSLPFMPIACRTIASHQCDLVNAAKVILYSPIVIAIIHGKGRSPTIIKSKFQDHGKGITTAILLSPSQANSSQFESPFQHHDTDTTPVIVSNLRFRQDRGCQSPIDHFGIAVELHGEATTSRSRQTTNILQYCRHFCHDSTTTTLPLLLLRLLLLRLLPIYHSKITAADDKRLFQ